MTKTTTTLWDPASHLSTADDVAAYLEAALQDGDPKLIAAALGDIARAKGMSQIARDAGLGRESLYKSLSSSGNPELATVLKVISAPPVSAKKSARFDPSTWGPNRRAAAGGSRCGKWSADRGSAHGAGRR